MNRKTISLLTLTIIITILLVACYGKSNSSYEDGANYREKDLEETENDLNSRDKLEEKIGQMSIEEKIGQILVVGFDEPTLDINTQKLIEEHHVGGVILFKRNIESPSQLLGLINSLKEANINNKFPLFLSLDEEGGLVSRMPDELVNTPRSKVIGQEKDEEFAYNTGKVIGQKINAFGFNMNFAPVLDIDSNPQNPVIGDRAYGDNKEIVTKMGIGIMKGLESQGVIAVVKHFPGHGDTVEDSHFGLPEIDKGLDDLLDFELFPFKRAIDEGVEGVMVAHILYKEIDRKNPATLSKSIIGDLLREELAFDGLVITDDMTMGAILDNYDLGEAAIRSVEAGSDLILVCHGFDNIKATLHALKEAVNNGRIPIERIDESVYRILRVKEDYGLKDDIIDSVDVSGINNRAKTLINSQ